MCGGPVNMLRAAIRSHVLYIQAFVLPPSNHSQSVSSEGLCLRCWGAEEKGIRQSHTLWCKAALKFILSWSTSLNANQDTGPVLQHCEEKGHFYVGIPLCFLHKYYYKNTPWVRVVASGWEKNKELDRGEWETQRENTSVRSSYTRLLCFRCRAGATIGGREWENIYLWECVGRYGHVTICCCYFFPLYIMLVTLKTCTVNLLYMQYLKKTL